VIKDRRRLYDHYEKQYITFKMKVWNRCDDLKVEEVQGGAFEAQI
jgi:hypothetical protein